jgi:hypothetical protein
MDASPTFYVKAQENRDRLHALIRSTEPDGREEP